MRHGSDRAFEKLYGRYGTRVRAYVLGMVGDYGRAEDLTQEIFLSALRRIQDTDRPIMFKPWIFEIAKNACIDEFRRARRSNEVPLDGEDGPEVIVAPWASAPEAAIENKQRLNDLQGAFQGLSETHHRMLVMRELEGMSYGQIGDRLGIPRPAVQSSLFRARRRLSEEYDELVSGRRCEQVQSVIAADGERPLLSLGVRQRRQVARHLAHCQPCRRVARMAAVDESFFRTPGLAGKIAALLPLGWLRLRRGGALRSSTAHANSVLAPLQSIAPGLDPSGVGLGMGRLAAAVAALAVAGAGSGVVSTLAARDHRPAPAVASHLSAASVQSATLTTSPISPGSAQVPPPPIWGTRSARARDQIRPASQPQRRLAASSGAGGTGASLSSTGHSGVPAPSSPVPPASAGKGGGATGVAGLTSKLPTGGSPTPPAPPPVLQDALNLLQSSTQPLNVSLPKLPQPAAAVKKVGEIVASLGHSSASG